LFEEMEVQEQQQQQTPQAQDAKYKLFDRVTSYPIVSSLMTKTVSVYGNVKDSSTIIKKSCESMENGMNWFAEKQIQPVLPPTLTRDILNPSFPLSMDLECVLWM